MRSGVKLIFKYGPVYEPLNVKLSHKVQENSFASIAWKVEVLMALIQCWKCPRMFYKDEGMKLICHYGFVVRAIECRSRQQSARKTHLPVWVRSTYGIDAVLKVSAKRR